MPLSLSFPLHFGAKKWRVSAGAAGEMRLALIVLLVRSHRLVSASVRGHSSCLVLSRFCRKIVRFSPAWDLLVSATVGGGGVAAVCVMLTLFSDDKGR